MERPTARQSAWQWQERIGIRDRKTLDGDQSLFFNRLMDLGDPLEDYDAVNKKYVDDVFGDGEIIVVIGSVDDIADLDLDPGSIAGSDADAVMAVHLAMYDHTNIHASNIMDEPQSTLREDPQMMFLPGMEPCGFQHHHPPLLPEEYQTST